MGRRPGASSTAALAIRRAAICAFVGAVIILCYVLVGADPAARPAMVPVTLAMIALPAAGFVVSVWFRDRCTRAWPAALLSYANLVGTVVLAHLDGGAATVLGFVVLPVLALVAIVMSRRRLVVFTVVSIGLYLAMAAVGEPAPPGYVVVYTLSFLMLTFVSARQAEALRSLRRRLARLADVDPLTGCLNRGAFDRRVTAEIGRASRSGEPVSLVLLDLDQFKQVNDTHGHGTGDEVLRWTGETLRAAVRPHDVVGRIGGDEFAVLLTEDVDDVVATTERLRAALAERVATSVGHATLPASRGATEDVDDLAEHLHHGADEQLYADKRARTGLEAPAGTPSRAATASSPAPEAASAPSAPRLVERLVPAALRRPVTRSEDRWRFAAVQIGVVGVLSFAIGLSYVLAFSGSAGDPWLVGAVSTGGVVSLVIVVGADRIVRMAHRRAVLLAFNAMVLVATVAALLRDGGVHSPMVLGLLNTIPLSALGASLRVSLPLIGVFTGAYAFLAVARGVDDGWYVVAHLGAFLTLALAYGTHARYATQQRRRLREVSRSDALTGCLNRRGFEEGFAAALARTERTGVPMSLVMIDLDGFKAVNDTAGHRAGDELLRWVGTTLRAACREYDSIGRLGGDEFAVVLPDTDSAGAGRLADRLRAVLGERTESSVGAATYTAGDDIETLYLRADRALYAHKARHRGDAAAARVPV